MITKDNGVVKLSGEDVQDLLVLTRHLSYDETSKMKGKFFNRVQYDGIAFALPEDHEVFELMKEKDLFQVTLKAGTRKVEIDGVETDAPTYQLVSWRSLKYSKILRMGEVELESITVENFKPTIAKNVGELEGLA